MNKVKELVLEIQRNGLPQYVKQSIEINSNGHVDHCLYPMVYLGQMKKYGFELDKKDVEDLLNQFDFSSWKEIENHTPNSYSYILKVFYEDDSIVVKKGYINYKMPDEYMKFEEQLLDLIPFIETPWLFSM